MRCHRDPSKKGTPGEAGLIGGATERPAMIVGGFAGALDAAVWRRRLESAGVGARLHDEALG